jgi:hypothetical protein
MSRSMFHRISCRLSVMGFALIGTFITADASTASAGSGFWAARNDTASGRNTWRFSMPTAADTITWTSGPNVTDGVGHAQNVFGPEQKFTTVPALAGRVLTGFTYNDGPSPSGSTTHTDGAGSKREHTGSNLGKKLACKLDCCSRTIGVSTIRDRPPRNRPDRQSPSQEEAELTWSSVLRRHDGTLALHALRLGKNCGEVFGRPDCAYRKSHSGRRPAHNGWNQMLDHASPGTIAEVRELHAAIGEQNQSCPVGQRESGTPVPR